MTIARLEGDGKYYKIEASDKRAVQKKCPDCLIAKLKLCQTMKGSLTGITRISRNATPDDIEKIKSEAPCLNP